LAGGGTEAGGSTDAIVGRDGHKSEDLRV
jgi:hypothetical protein